MPRPHPSAIRLRPTPSRRRRGIKPTVSIHGPFCTFRIVEFALACVWERNIFDAHLSGVSISTEAMLTPPSRPEPTPPASANPATSPPSKPAPEPASAQHVPPQT